ncbi:hypothetical protein HRbin01_01933 [archaeon HR01]|nr:hypothetical protein HRbin01_01933 [archaeon HR01]
MSSSLDGFIEGSGKPKLTVEYVLKALGEANRVRMAGKAVGYLVDTPLGKLYVTKRRPEERFRKFDSWGVSEDVLRTAARLGAEKVVIISGDEGWLSDIRDWFTKAIPYWWREGHELQRHLPLKEQEKLPYR